MIDLTLIGAGGHAKSVIAALPKDFKAVRFVDPKIESFEGLEYAGNDDEFLKNFLPSTSNILITVVSDSSCSLGLRKKLIDKFKEYHSPVIVADSAIVIDKSILRRGTMVMHRAFINTDVEIGEDCIVNTGAIIEHDCKIGSNVIIGPGAVICGGVTIGDNVYVGAGSTIRPGVSICSNAIVGFGSAIGRDIDKEGTYFGVPARRI